MIFSPVKNKDSGCKQVCECEAAGTNANHFWVHFYNKPLTWLWPQQNIFTCQLLPAERWSLSASSEGPLKTTATRYFKSYFVRRLHLRNAGSLLWLKARTAMIVGFEKWVSVPTGNNIIQLPLLNNNVQAVSQCLAMCIHMLVRKSEIWDFKVAFWTSLQWWHECCHKIKPVGQHTLNYFVATSIKQATKHSIVCKNLTDRSNQSVH